MLFSLGVACSQDDSLTATVDPVPEGGRNANPYAVTVEEALANLEGVLAQIDGETRAGGMRRAVSVDRVKAADVCDLTRSEAALDVEDLLYVVSFGEGNGSAVLGADKRVTQVMAVLDETVLTAEDFVKFDTRATSLEEKSSKDQMKDMLLGAMVKSSTRALLIPPDTPTPPDPIGPVTPVAPEIETVISNQSQIGPLLRTKWNQGGSAYTGIYNVHYDDYCGGCPAGCGPIAMCQLLTYLQAPNPNIISGVQFDWSLISQDVYGGTPTAEAKDEVARYIRQMGAALGTTYTPSGSSTDSDEMEDYLQEIGYSGANVVYYDLNRIYDQLTNRKPPIIIGIRTDGKGHAWLLDGRTYYRIRTYLLLYDGDGNLLSRQLSTDYTIHMYHFNLGWGGYLDGYYDVDYSTYYIGSPEEIEEEIGDYNIGNGNITVYSDLKMIIY